MKQLKAIGQIALIFVAATMISACSKKRGANGDFGLGASETSNGANGIGYREGPVTPGTERDFTVNVGDKVFFKTDSARLTADSENTLVLQAKWLNQYPGKTITIEGHSDERGTREYNLGLAAKRAQTVKGFLSRRGVNSARIRTISYGKERPISVCNDISCWSQNRRGVTILNKRG
ncbi:MAG: OmpA family protein [Hyphomicrobiaceae bacterium]|nr:OmpA family protein [Hyphomicrobiaceae bacterium]